MNKEISVLDMARGMSNNDFVFYYQPIVSLVTGQITGAEALLRWQKNADDLILPGKFIPLAEKSGFISEITQEMLPIVFKDLMQMSASDPTISVSFNTSAKDFADTSIVNQIANLISRYEIDPGRLHIEITETAFLPLDKTTIESLFAINEIGAKIVLNDFSAGHSTFDYLSQLPFSALKVAIPLVQRITTAKADFRLLRHLVSLAHQLHYEIIAEGIENQELHSLILSTGCTAAQGYYYSYPLPFEDYIDLLETKKSWTDYPYGLVYLAQLDIIDFTRDVIREALIINTAKDEVIKKNAEERLPSLEYSETSFAKWYFGSKDYEFMEPSNFMEIGKKYDLFHKSAVALIKDAKSNGKQGNLVQSIRELSGMSSVLMSTLTEISSNSLIHTYFP